MNEKARQLHGKVTELLESTHCRKHGMEWEACCFADAVLEIHNKVMLLLTAVRKEEREAAFKDAEQIAAERAQEYAVRADTELAAGNQAFSDAWANWMKGAERTRQAIQAARLRSTEAAVSAKGEGEWLTPTVPMKSNNKT